MIDDEKLLLKNGPRSKHWFFHPRQWTRKFAIVFFACVLLIVTLLALTLGLVLGLRHRHEKAAAAAQVRRSASVRPDVSAADMEEVDATTSRRVEEEDGEDEVEEKDDEIDEDELNGEFSNSFNKFQYSIFCFL